MTTVWRVSCIHGRCLLRSTLDRAEAVELARAGGLILDVFRLSEEQAAEMVGAGTGTGECSCSTEDEETNV